MSFIFDSNFFLGSDGSEPNNPATGQAVAYFQDGKFKVKNSSGVVAELTPGSVYGQNQESDFDATEKTNGDNTPLQVYSFTTQNLPAGEYEFWIQMNYRINTTGSSFNARAYIDGNLALELTQEMKDATNYEFNGGFIPDVITTFTGAGTHIFTIEIWPESSTYVASIKNIYLKLKRIA